jgi:hypothetical protein
MCGHTKFNRLVPTQVVMSEKSKSVPFLDATAALSGKDLPAGVGFDPLGLSDISFDFRLAAHSQGLARPRSPTSSLLILASCVRVLQLPDGAHQVGGQPHRPVCPQLVPGERGALPLRLLEPTLMLPPMDNF